MSYILEALKKAQAERQLGNAPTLNAVPVGAPPPARAHARAVPALAIGAVVAAALVLGGVVWWARAPAPAVVLTAPVAVVPAPAPTPAPAAVVAPAPVPAAPALAVAPASKPVVEAPPVQAQAPKPAAVKPPAAPEEERLPALRDLPENVRAAIPQVSFGGYMYSNNPADRLLLIDKVLRHEGEEVAPGLVLEKLLPKAAVMNYRGTRYKVAY
jgi:general secretion pathway protein B